LSELAVGFARGEHVVLVGSSRGLGVRAVVGSPSSSRRPGLEEVAALGSQVGRLADRGPSARGSRGHRPHGARRSRR